MISYPCGHFDPKFQVQGIAPTNNFCTVSWANECLTTLPLTVFTQRNFVADFPQAKCIFWKIGRFAFLGDLGATYDDHLRLIGKRVVYFLLALIELFSLSATAEALRAIIGSKSAVSLKRGPVDPIFQYFCGNYLMCFIETDFSMSNGLLHPNYQPNVQVD